MHKCPRCSDDCECSDDKDFCFHDCDGNAVVIGTRKDDGIRAPLTLTELVEIVKGDLETKV